VIGTCTTLSTTSCEGISKLGIDTFAISMGEEIWCGVGKGTGEIISKKIQSLSLPLSCG